MITSGNAQFWHSNCIEWWCNVIQRCPSARKICQPILHWRHITKIIGFQSCTIKNRMEDSQNIIMPIHAQWHVCECAFLTCPNWVKGHIGVTWVKKVISSKMLFPFRLHDIVIGPVHIVKKVIGLVVFGIHLTSQIIPGLIECNARLLVFVKIITSGKKAQSPGWLKNWIGSPWKFAEKSRSAPWCTKFIMG